MCVVNWLCFSVRARSRWSCVKINDSDGVPSQRGDVAEQKKSKRHRIQNSSSFSTSIFQVCHVCICLLVEIRKHPTWPWYDGTWHRLIAEGQMKLGNEPRPQRETGGSDAYMPRGTQRHPVACQAWWDFSTQNFRQTSVAFSYDREVWEGLRREIKSGLSSWDGLESFSPLSVEWDHEARMQGPLDSLCRG